MADAIVVTPAPAAKPGYKTTEFWGTLAGAIAPYLIAAIPPQYAVIASTVLGGIYTIGRTVVKYKQDEGKWSGVALPGDAPPQP